MIFLQVYRFAEPSVILYSLNIFWALLIFLCSGLCTAARACTTCATTRRAWRRSSSGRRPLPRWSRCWGRYVSAVVPRVALPRVTCLTYRTQSGLLVILFLVIATWIASQLLLCLVSKIQFNYLKLSHFSTKACIPERHIVSVSYVVKLMYVSNVVLLVVCQYFYL